MAVYVDFTFYTTTFLGTAITAEDFPKLALRASAQIDLLTSNRVADIITLDEDDETIEKIQMATCDVAEALQTLDADPGVSQESVGAHSVTYVAGVSSERTLLNAASTYLASTGLLFKGFYDGEYGSTPSDDE